MATGTVKWFNDQKGFGFIKQDDVNEDIFVHHTAIKMEGFRTLAPGEPVDYELNQDDKGFKAINVTRSEQAPAAEIAPEAAPQTIEAPAEEIPAEEAPAEEILAEETPEAAPQTIEAPAEEAIAEKVVESTPEQA
jgi:CspA family cold shock protein